MRRRSWQPRWGQLVTGVALLVASLVMDFEDVPHAGVPAGLGLAFVLWAVVFGDVER